MVYSGQLALNPPHMQRATAGPLTFYPILSYPIDMCFMGCECSKFLLESQHHTPSRSNMLSILPIFLSSNTSFLHRQNPLSLKWGPFLWALQIFALSAGKFWALTIQWSFTMIASNWRTKLAFTNTVLVPHGTQYLFTCNSFWCDIPIWCWGHKPSCFSFIWTKGGTSL